MFEYDTSPLQEDKRTIHCSLAFPKVQFKAGQLGELFQFCKMQRYDLTRHLRQRYRERLEAFLLRRHDWIEKNLIKESNVGRDFELFQSRLTPEQESKLG